MTVEWWAVLILIQISCRLPMLTAVVVLVTSQGWWPAIGAFITGQPTLTVLAGFPLAFALLVGAAGWMSIRRATP